MASSACASPSTIAISQYSSVSNDPLDALKSAGQQIATPALQSEARHGFQWSDLVILCERCGKPAICAAQYALLNCLRRITIYP